MTSLWFSVFAFAMSWWFVVPLYDPPQPLVWTALVLAGVGSSVFAVRNVEVAGVGSAVPKRVGSVGLGVAVSTLVLATQAVIVPAYLALAPRFGEARWAVEPVSAIFRALGVRAGASAQGVLLDTGTANLVYSLNWEKLGAFTCAMFAIGAVPVLVLWSRRPRRYAVPLLMAIAFVYSMIRIAAVILMSSASASVEPFWSGLVTLLTFLPLVAVVSGALPLVAPGRLALPKVPAGTRRFWFTAALAAAAGVMLVGAFGFNDPGTRKSGRVMIDEGHSDWERTTDAFDTEWYGATSGYNYYNLYGYLDLHYEMSRNFEPIDDEVLAECDVLILKTPTNAYAGEEIASIVRFVRDGGGLWLVGDHTNVFGISTNLNPLAEEFGVHFNHDATYDLSSGNLSEYSPPAVLPHPIAQNMPGAFLFGTSCSLEASPAARSVITGLGLKALAADYSQENFFPSVPASERMRFGPLLQGVAVEHGKGRVAAFSDSTVFSNFWMFMPGKPELALSYVEWLNRENTFLRAPLWLLGVGLLLLVTAVWVAQRLGRFGAVLAIVLGVLVAVPVAAVGYGAATQMSYGLPSPRTPYVEISFEQQYSDFALPSTVEGFATDPDKTLSTFYVWTQRLGYVPKLEPSLAEAIDGGDVTVVVRPAAAPTQRDADLLVRYVEEGGRLLVVDDLAAPGSVSGALLEPFGLSADDAPLDAPAIVADGVRGDPVELGTEAGGIVGGTPLLVTQEGDVVCAYAERGEGVVAVLGDAGMFFDDSMGGVNVVPNARQESINWIEFDLMRFLAQGSEFSS